jgi:hypothetical protein
MRKTLVNLLLSGCFVTISILGALAQNHAGVASKLNFKVTIMGELKDVDGGGLTSMPRCAYFASGGRCVSK